MRVKVVMLSILLSFSLAATADDKKADCGLAIDAADKIVPDPKDDCDYTKTGLNGALHKALANKKEPEVNPSVPVKNVDDKKEVLTEKLVTNEFSNMQELEVLKFNLLAQAAASCPKGFVVDAERYIPSANKAMKIEFVYRCL